MALNWYWDDKVGEAEVFNYDKVVTYNLYQGNAFLIFIYEYKDEDGKDMYSLASFFADETHAKRCLGLAKDCDNIFNTTYSKLLKVRINKKYSYTKKLVDMLIKAFDNITIELYTDEVEEKGE